MVSWLFDSAAVELTLDGHSPLIIHYPNDCKVGTFSSTALRANDTTGLRYAINKIRVLVLSKLCHTENRVLPAFDRY